MRHCHDMQELCDFERAHNNEIDTEILIQSLT